MATPKRKQKAGGKQTKTDGGVFSPNAVPETAEATPTPDDNINQIRDILFGSQAREFEKRFALMESQHQKETARLREDIDQRLNALEAMVRKEFESLGSRVQSEQEQRAESVLKVTDELKKTAAALTQSIQQTEGDLNQHTRELRQQLQQQSEQITETLENANERTNEALIRSTRQLDNSKVDKSALADLMAEVSARLLNASPSESDRPQKAKHD